MSGEVVELFRHNFALPFNTWKARIERRGFWWKWFWRGWYVDTLLSLIKLFP